MTTLLITGSNGQLGNEFRAIAPLYTHLRFVFTDVDTLDITHPNALRDALLTQKVDYVINCAAYTAVDKAEANVDAAHKINAEAVAYLGVAAAHAGAKVIHISTDYVYNGFNCRPYEEACSVDPRSVYGRTKAEGERSLFAACPDSIVVRTSWLYSAYGNNFVKTMIRLGRERTELKVVFDQVGTPTYAADLAEAILRMVDRAEQGDFLPGIYHYSNEGVCSWYDFALKIHRLAQISTCRILPIGTADYPTPAPRPPYSVLNKNKIKSTFGLTVPHWEESLERLFTQLTDRHLP